MKCSNCKYLRWAEEYPGMPFFGWCDNVNDSPDMDMERECGCFESATHADIIRRTSDEELANEMRKRSISTRCDIVCQGECKAIATLNKASNEACGEIIMKWLQQPAEEDA